LPDFGFFPSNLETKDLFINHLLIIDFNLKRAFILPSVDYSYPAIIIFLKFIITISHLDLSYLMVDQIKMFYSMEVNLLKFHFFLLLKELIISYLFIITYL